MSGGVDSSVSAALLKQTGFDVTGVYMKQWSPKVLGKECIWQQERQDAMRVANQIGIKFLTWDFSKEYEKQVGKYMIDSYKNGITPNPDVMCNKVIKFGLFFDRAVKSGADFIATGHYAKLVVSSEVVSRKRKLQTTNYKLQTARDTSKDQTYFLYTLNKKQLGKIIFPVGDYLKPEVRKLAKKFKLHTAEKKDSQGVCFIGPLDMKRFLKSYIKPKKGKIFSIVDTPTLRRVGVKGSVRLGEHDGVYYYTIGQRHGLDIKDGKGPYFVVKKDIRKNVIYVGKEKDLFSKQAKIKNINWLQKPEKFPALVDVRMRYRAPLAKARIYKNGNLVFIKPEKAIAPGQSAVFYRKNQVLGGGVII